MAGRLLPPFFVATDTLGNIISGGTIEFDEAGTTTDLTVYSDEGLTVSLGTSVSTNSAGYPSSDGTTPVSVYAAVAGKVVLKDADGNTVRTVDNIELLAADPISSVESIAALKALPAPTSTAEFNLLGYYTAGDGGGGRVRFDTTSSDTADDVLVFAPASGTGRWHRVIEDGRITSKQAGAKHDDNTDDTLRLQTWLDAAGANSLCAFLSEGTARVSRQVTPGNYNYALRVRYSNTVIDGIPRLSILKMVNGATGDGTVLRTAFEGQDGSGVISGRMTGFTVRNITIDGNWDNVTWDGPTDASTSVYDQNGLGIYAVDEVRVENVRVLDCGQDSLIAASCSDLVFDTCEVINSGKGNISVNLTHDAEVRNCIAENANGSPDGNVSKAIYTLTSDGYAGIFVDNDSWDTSQTNTKCTVHNNRIHQTHGRGIAAGTGDAQIVLMTDNNISVDGEHGISLLGKASGASMFYVIGGSIEQRPASGTPRAISSGEDSELVQITGVSIYGASCNAQIVLADPATSIVESCTISGTHTSTDQAINFRDVTDAIARSNWSNGRISLTGGTTTNLYHYSNVMGNSVNGTPSGTDDSSGNSY